MSQITKPNTLVAGNPILATEHNENFNTLYNDFNGGITNYNFATTAGITDDKLSSIVTAGKVNFTAISTAGATSGSMLIATSTTSLAVFATGTSGQYLSWGKQIDEMEYASNTSAQAAYVTNATFSEVVDQENTTVDTAEALGDESDREYRQAQGFILSGAKTLTAVEVYRENNEAGASGNWTLRIETESSGKPSGTLADLNATVTITAPAQNTVGKGTFATPFALLASTQYHLVVLCDNQTTGNKWYIKTNSTSVYGSGTRSESQDGGTTWTAKTGDLYFKIYIQGEKYLQAYSESTIKTQGLNSLKVDAKATGSLNKTLTRTISSPINLTGCSNLRFFMRSNRAGSNIKIGLHDSGGTTTETTPNITDANVWQLISWDISGVANANKDVIDKIVITVVNADADNTFYLDNFYSMEATLGWQGP